MNKSYNLLKRLLPKIIYTAVVLSLVLLYKPTNICAAEVLYSDSQSGSCSTGTWTFTSPGNTAKTVTGISETIYGPYQFAGVTSITTNKKDSSLAIGLNDMSSASGSSRQSTQLQVYLSNQPMWSTASDKVLYINTSTTTQVPSELWEQYKYIYVYIYSPNCTASFYSNRGINDGINIKYSTQTAKVFSVSIPSASFSIYGNKTPAISGIPTTKTIQGGINTISATINNAESQIWQLFVDDNWINIDESPYCNQFAGYYTENLEFTPIGLDLDNAQVRVIATNDEGSTISNSCTLQFQKETFIPTLPNAGLTDIKWQKNEILYKYLIKITNCIPNFL